jgi:asparagine synthase (glutamine-hydrolysing)
MCGFIFVALRNDVTKPVDAALLRHRGPDNSGELDFGWSRIRHWRLSIQDLTSNSDQPMSDYRYCLAYNGEIYDYKAIGKRLYKTNFESDTQLMFHVLKAGDFDAIKYESGFYSLIYLDQKKKSIIARRDFFGKKPLYVYSDGSLLVVASEESAIKLACRDYGRDLNLNYHSVAHYFQYKDLHYGATYIDGIEEVVPGGAITFDYETWTISFERTWEDYYKEPAFYKRPFNKFCPGISENLCNAQLEKYVLETIDKRFISDVPLQISLSGGIDSSLLAIQAQRSGARLIRALTVTSTHRPSELRKSKLLCNSLAIEHTTINFDQIDVYEYLRRAILAQGGPLSHPHSLALFVLAEEASKVGKVIITGEGADELFCGYEHYKLGLNATVAFKSHLMPSTYFNCIDEGVRGRLNNLRTIPDINGYFEENDGRDLDVKTHLLSLLRRNDRISMRNSVELRSAFLDEKLFRYVSQLQGNSGLMRGKDVLVKMIRDRYVDFQQDNLKIGFYVPFDEWFESAAASHPEVKFSINKALCLFETRFGWRLKAGVRLEKKLAWALLNIGIFATQEEQATYG